MSNDFIEDIVSKYEFKIEVVANAVLKGRS